MTQKQEVGIIGRNVLTGWGKSLVESQNGNKIPEPWEGHGVNAGQEVGTRVVGLVARVLLSGLGLGHGLGCTPAGTLPASVAKA